MIPRTTHLHALFVIGLAALALAAISRACAVPAGGGETGRAYIPHADGAPIRPCDYRNSALACWHATETRIAAVSPTSTATLGRWASRTPTPAVMPLARTVPLAGVTLAGQQVGQTADIGGGLHYTAAHILPSYAPWRLDVGGLPVVAWQIDPTRDLAQVATRWPAGPATARLGQSAVGDVVEIRLTSGPATAVYAGLRLALDTGGGYVMYPDGATDAGLVRVHGGCVRTGPRLGYGASGAGVWTLDGALVGVMVTAEQPEGLDPWCLDAGQAVTWEAAP